MPLAARGNHAKHVVAFARVSGSETAITVVGRLFLRLCNSHGFPMGERIWRNTSLVLPRKIQASRFCDIVTGRTIEAEQCDGHFILPLAKLFAQCPSALLFSGGGD